MMLTRDWMMWWLSKFWEFQFWFEKYIYICWTMGVCVHLSLQSTRFQRTESTDLRTHIYLESWQWDKHHQLLTPAAECVWRDPCHPMTSSLHMPNKDIAWEKNTFNQLKEALSNSTSCFKGDGTISVFIPTLLRAPGVSRTSVIVLIVSRRMTAVSAAVCFWYMGPQGQRYATLCSHSQAVPVAGSSFTMHSKKEQNITQLKYNFCPTRCWKSMFPSVSTTEFKLLL